jgi:hypothetical protein
VTEDRSGRGIVEPHPTQSERGGGLDAGGSWWGESAEGVPHTVRGRSDDSEESEDFEEPEPIRVTPSLGLTEDGLGGSAEPPRHVRRLPDVRTQPAAGLCLRA